jgi:hypothetical protein
VTKVGTEEKGHFPYTVISEPLYVSLEDHGNKQSEEGKLPYESGGWSILHEFKQPQKDQISDNCAWYVVKKELVAVTNETPSTFVPLKDCIWCIIILIIY